MPRFCLSILLLILASVTTLAGRSTANAQVVTLLPTQAGGAATVTAGDDVTYNLTLTNGAANPIPVWTPGRRRRTSDLSPATGS